jgi:hypothetical protein
MKISSKLILGFMLVMMICCVSAVSATDINGTDDAIITDDIAVDDVSEIVEEVEIDDASDDVVEEQNLRNTTGNINGNSYTNYFDNNGYLNDSSVYTLTFNGYFDEVSPTFGNFKINRSIALELSNATFHNIGFDILANNVDVVDTTFTGDASATNNATIGVYAKNVAIANVNIDVAAPEGRDFYAIDIENTENTHLINNTIIYNCNYTNPTNFNYGIKAKNTPNMIIRNNTINATVPLKTVNWALSGSIDADYVAGIAIENCTSVNFIGNTLNVIGDKRAGDYPTLDAFIIANTKNAVIEDNVINENDIVTGENQYSYIYGIDVYSCDNIHINNNTVNMNGNKSGGHIEGGNGTGAAYCIQLSGNHSNVIISNNKLTTKNQGPNLGIYSQNYHARSYLKIYGNTIDVSGKAGNDPWSLVSGIEVQDTSATISGNTITVNNTANYTYGNYAFGISYAQWTNHTHYYDIEDNTVTVYNGDYAVYLMNDTSVGGNVEWNTLKAIPGSNNPVIGDVSVFHPDTVHVENND